MMKTPRFPITVLAAMLALASVEACSRKQDSASPSSPQPGSPAAAGAEGPDATVHMTTTLPSSAAARREPNARPFDPGSTHGAVDVLKVYYAMIGAKRYADASIWREEAGPSGPASDSALASAFERYASYSVKVGEPGQATGAPGAVHVTIPVEVHGRLKTGGDTTEAASVDMHRINDTAEAKDRRMSWRISRIETRPGR